LCNTDTEHTVSQAGGKGGEKKKPPDLPTA
jgi:hypothetical protein